MTAPSAMPARRPASIARKAARLHLRRPPLCGLCRRHARLGAARQRRASGRPLVQVSPPARHLSAPARRSRTRSSTSTAAADARTPNLRATQVELYDGLVRRAARTAGRRSPSTSARSTICSRAFVLGRLLLQDLHVAESFWQNVYEPFDPPRRRASAGADASPIRTATPAATPIATCWSSAPARPASPRRSPPPRPARASSLRRAGGTRRLAAAPMRRHDRRTSGARNGLRATSCRACATMPNVTLLPRTTAFGYYRQNLRRRWSSG